MIFHRKYDLKILQLPEKYRYFNGNLFMPSEWKNGMLECWNIGDKGGNKPF